MPIKTKRVRTAEENLWRRQARANKKIHPSYDNKTSFMRDTNKKEKAISKIKVLFNTPKIAAILPTILLDELIKKIIIAANEHTRHSLVEISLDVNNDIKKINELISQLENKLLKNIDYLQIK